jgi:hypothetical protein
MSQALGQTNGEVAAGASFWLSVGGANRASITQLRAAASSGWKEEVVNGLKREATDQIYDDELNRLL